jgi:hypothetical protein
MKGENKMPRFRVELSKVTYLEFEAKTSDEAEEKAMAWADGDWIVEDRTERLPDPGPIFTEEILRNLENKSKKNKQTRDEKGIHIWDENDYEWIYNGHRVYMVLAEAEFIENHDDVEQNGYGCFSLKDAYIQLLSGGYISEMPQNYMDGGTDD